MDFIRIPFIVVSAPKTDYHANGRIFTYFWVS